MKALCYLTLLCPFLTSGFLAASPPLQAPSEEMAKNSGLIVYQGANPNDFMLSWWGYDEHFYFIEQSYDLKQWSFFPMVEEGLEEPMTVAFQSNTDRLFLRLKYSNDPESDLLSADFSGTRVSNWDEIQLGLNPFLFEDSDNVGLPDAWQLHHFGQLGNHPNELTDSGLSYRDYFLNDINPSNKVGVFEEDPNFSAIILKFPSEDEILDISPIGVSNSGMAVVEYEQIEGIAYWRFRLVGEPEMLQPLPSNFGSSVAWVSNVTPSGLIGGTVSECPDAYCGDMHSRLCYWTEESPIAIAITASAPHGVEYLSFLRDDGTFYGIRNQAIGQDQNTPSSGQPTSLRKGFSGTIENGWTHPVDDLWFESYIYGYDSNDQPRWRWRHTGHRKEIYQSNLAGDYLAYRQHYSAGQNNVTSTDYVLSVSSTLVNIPNRSSAQLNNNGDFSLLKEGKIKYWTASNEFVLPLDEHPMGLSFDDEQMLSKLITENYLIQSRSNSPGNNSSPQNEQEKFIYLPFSKLLPHDALESFTPKHLSENGDFILGVGREPASSPSEEGKLQAVLLMPLQFTHFVYDVNTGEIQPSGGTVPESNPIPNLTLIVTAAEINPNGALVIEMEGSFRDPISELLPSGQRLTSLAIRLNGELLETIDGLDALSGGHFNPDIQSYNSLVSFSRTFTIPQAHFGSHILSIEAGPNAAGNLGRAAVGIAVNEIPATTQPAAPSFPLSVQFSEFPSDQTADSIVFFSGNREPLPEDPVATETTAESRTFTGTLLVDQMPRTGTFWMWDADITEFDPAQIDSFTGGFHYIGEGDEEFIFLGTWTETSPDSQRFYPTEFFNEYETLVPVVAGIFPLEGTREGHVLPYTVRIDDSVRRETLFHPEGGSMTVSINGTSVPLVSYSRSDNPEMEDPDYFLGEDGKPRVFLNMRNSPLPIPMGDTEGIMTYALHARTTDDELTRYHAYAEFAPEEELPVMAAAMSGGGDEDAEWEEQTYYFFDLLYGDVGKKYLQAYTQTNGSIEFKNLGWTNFSGYKYQHAWMFWKGDPEIEIERDQTPPEAAMKLFTAINHFIIRHNHEGGVQRRYLQLTQFDPEAFAQIRQESLAFGAQNATLLAEVYLSGYSLIAQPIDWIFIARDVEQGQYLSLAAALPFVSIQAVRYGKAVTIQLPSGATSRIQGAPLSALAEAAQANTRLHRMEILSPHIVSGGLDSETVGLLYRSGFLQARNTPSRLLAQDMARVGKGNRPWRHQAHHDLPTQFEEFFIRAGIDPNHGDFGRWIPNRVHTRWHNAKGFDPGGSFNHAWKDFFGQFPSATKQQILDRLDQIRLGTLPPIQRPGMPDFPVNFAF
jgi:hypothetical protein